MISGVTSRLPLHFVFLNVLHPRKYPLRPWRTSKGAPQSGQVSLTSTFGSFFRAAGMYHNEVFDAPGLLDAIAAFAREVTA